MLEIGDPLPDLHKRTIPLLTVDHVLEPALCHQLIAHFQAGAPHRSPSFGLDASGEPALVVLPELKARLDLSLSEPALRTDVVDRLQRRLLPEVWRCLAHRPVSFEAPKLVRYPAGEGWFAPHRDNSTPDAAHRRLAVTINLDDAYTGGALRFSELGDELYSPLAGSAIVFSCGLLHEVTPVVTGARHALITFLW